MHIELEQISMVTNNLRPSNLEKEWHAGDNNLSYLINSFHMWVFKMLKNTMYLQEEHMKESCFDLPTLFIIRTYTIDVRSARQRNHGIHHEYNVSTYGFLFWRTITKKGSNVHSYFRRGKTIINKWGREKASSSCIWTEDIWHKWATPLHRSHEGG